MIARTNGPGKNAVAMDESRGSFSFRADRGTREKYGAPSSTISPRERPWFSQLLNSSTDRGGGLYALDDLAAPPAGRWRRPWNEQCSFLSLAYESVAQMDFDGGLANRH